MILAIFNYFSIESGFLYFVNIKLSLLSNSCKIVKCLLSNLTLIPVLFIICSNFSLSNLICKVLLSHILIQNRLIKQRRSYKSKLWSVLSFFALSNKCSIL